MRKSIRQITLAVNVTCGLIGAAGRAEADFIYTFRFDGTTLAFLVYLRRKRRSAA